MEGSGTRSTVARVVVVAVVAMAVAARGLAQAAQAIPPEIPRLQLSPSSGAAGVSVVARGSFEGIASPLGTGIASEAVALYFGRRMVATGATNSHGVFTIPFSVPTAPAGLYQVTAHGQSTQRVATATFTIAPGLSAGARPVTLRPALSWRARPVTLRPALSWRARPVTLRPALSWRARPVTLTSKAIN
jgi:hypothetical protein